MDLAAIFTLLADGGPMAVLAAFLIVGLFFWYTIGNLEKRTDKSIMDLRSSVAALQSDFNKFQVAHAKNHLSKSDLGDLNARLAEHMQRTEDMMSKLFDLVRQQSDRCGKDCQAAMLTERMLAGRGNG